MDLDNLSEKRLEVLEVYESELERANPELLPTAWIQSGRFQGCLNSIIGTRAKQCTPPTRPPTNKTASPDFTIHSSAQKWKPLDKLPKSSPQIGGAQEGNPR